MGRKIIKATHEKNREEDFQQSFKNPYLKYLVGGIEWLKQKWIDVKVADDITTCFKKNVIR